MRHLLLLAITTTAFAQQTQPLPGTAPLTISGDLSFRMQAQVDSFLLREIAGSVSKRQKMWRRDFSSTGAYENSILANRDSRSRG
jgi:hypothetical protein